MSFLKGCGEYYMDFRLPLIVRSIEALIMPDKGKTTKQFKLRASKWWPKDTEDELFNERAIDALGEIYEIRCALDHLHGLKKGIAEKAMLRSRQCERLARIAYQDILLNEDKLKKFESDDTIKKYWNK